MLEYTFYKKFGDLKDNLHRSSAASQNPLLVSGSLTTFTLVISIFGNIVHVSRSVEVIYNTIPRRTEYGIECNFGKQNGIVISFIICYPNLGWGW